MSKSDAKNPALEYTDYERKVLASVLDFFLEPSPEDEQHIGLKIDTLDVTIKDETICDTEIIVNEFSPDFAWAGLVQLSSGQLLKIVLQGFYITESMAIL